MITFIVAMFLYAMALIAEIITQTQYTFYGAICSQISLFSGALASILLLLVLVPTFGWSLLILWCIIFVKVLHNSVGELTYKALLNVLQVLVDHNLREQPHRLLV
ncbi:hypothetical protein ACSBR2_016929 [Camellia fascicularis]